jgi:molybdenum cofactor biosynthesis enzyme MoaA
MRLPNIVRKVVTGRTSLVDVVAHLLNRKARLIHLELTNQCNLACKACYRSGALRESMDTGITMSLTDIKALLDSYQSAEVRAFVLSGGENLLHQEFFTVLEAIRERFPSRTITLSTNGVLLSRDHALLERVCSSDLNNIQLSLHGAKQQTASLLQPGIVIPPMLAAMRYIAEHSVIDVTVNFVIQEENVDEMVEFVELLATTRVRDLTVSFTPMNYAGHTEQPVDYNALWEKMGVRQKLARATARARDLGIRVPVLKLECTSLFSVDVLTASGAMLPCWGNYLVKRHALGNALHEKPSTIRKKPELRNLQAALRKGEIPELCVACWANGRYSP